LKNGEAWRGLWSFIKISKTMDCDFEKAFAYVLSSAFLPTPSTHPISVGPLPFPSRFLRKLNEKHRRRGWLHWLPATALKRCGAGDKEWACDLLCSCCPGLGRNLDKQARPLDRATFQPSQCLRSAVFAALYPAATACVTRSQHPSCSSQTVTPFRHRCS
jgi:hypothetical protein